MSVSINYSAAVRPLTDHVYSGLSRMGQPFHVFSSVVVCLMWLRRRLLDRYIRAVAHHSGRSIIRNYKRDSETQTRHSESDFTARSETERRFPTTNRKSSAEIKATFREFETLFQKIQKISYVLAVC